MSELSIEQIAREYQGLINATANAYNEILKNRKMIYEIALALHGIIPKEKWDALNQKLVALSAADEGKEEGNK